MKLSKQTNRVMLAWAVLSLFASLMQPTEAFFGIGGCPEKYPRGNNPFGDSGQVVNGQYYSHFLDDQYWTFMEDLMVPNLPAPWRPTGSRRYHDCNTATIQKRQNGVYFLRTDMWNGTAYGPIPYNYTCFDISCADPQMQSTFDVVYHRPTDNLLILYGCIEMTEMVQVLLQDSMPLIL